MSVSRPATQRGAALLIALLAVALASVIAVALLERGQRSLARTEALLSAERAWQYAQGMEVLAAETLRRAQDEEFVAAMLDGAWTAPFEVPGGFVQGRLLDQNARFNLNAVAHPDAAQAERARAAFERLLDSLGLDPLISAELVDWIEGPSVPRAGSAGDDWYGRLSPPYRTAGTLLAHRSELRWLRSVDADAWNRLAPRVTALPEPVLLINVNSGDEWVLASLFEQLGPDEARRVLADGPYRELAQVLAHPLIESAAGPGAQGHLSVRGRWYLAQARVTLDGIERDYFRLLTAAGPGYDDFRYLSQGTP